MKTWTKVAMGLALVTLVAAGGAYAFGRGMRSGKFMKHMVAMRVEAAEDFIDATPDQRKVIDAAKDAALAKLEARMAAHQGEREQWLQLLVADKVSANDLYAKVDAKADEAKALARELVPELIKVHDVLTPAQRQKLAEHAKQMHGRHGPGHGGFGGPGFGGPGGPGGFGGPGGEE
jgi:Spy/CpxP family protein refolding chaperone